jgi:hypothetical protein
LTEWYAVIVGKMPHLSKPQAYVLAIYSFGMIIAQSCGQTKVSFSIAALLNMQAGSVRQRLREWYFDRKDKRGKNRMEIEVSKNFVPLLQWVLSWWAPGEKRLALAMDATSLGQNLVVLALSVVYRGCAIPIAWCILSATKKGSWKKEWLSLFALLDNSIPSDWLVIVMADRGLYARWLYIAIKNCHWHPFLRVNGRGLYRTKDSNEFKPLSLAVQTPGFTWSGLVICFKANPIEATLLARWEAGYKDPWLILTDLPVEQASATWYSLRAWIERGFKHIKSAGWRWDYTRMTDPKRAARLWLAIAVATLWVLSVGGEADASIPVNSFLPLPEDEVDKHTIHKKTARRLLSCFRRGVIIIISALISQKPLPFGTFFPEPWPS